MENELKEGIRIDLLTPLTANFFPDQRYGEEYTDEEYEYGIPLTGADLTQYEAEIRDMVDWMNKNECLPTEAVCDLMTYFRGSMSVKEKVRQAVVSVKEVDGILYGCTELKLNEFLEEPELKELCEYITGQYSDGWGEGFEQRDIKVDGGHLNVYFYTDKNFHFQKKESELTGQGKHPEKGKRPKMKLIGQDGNIFSIMGRASRLLKENGQNKEAEEMFERVKSSGSYYQALGIISEYVETELSSPQKEEKKKMGKNREER